MADGSLRAIEEVKVGDIVISFDEKTEELKQDKVSEFFKHDADRYLIINGHLKVTGNHLVYSKGRWVQIGQLNIGDTILNYKSKSQAITSKAEISEKVLVYNLEINPYHAYIADGFVVHNVKMLPEDSSQVIE